MLLTIFPEDDSYDFNLFLYILGITDLLNFLLDDIALTKNLQDI